MLAGGLGIIVFLSRRFIRPMAELAQVMERAGKRSGKKLNYFMVKFGIG